MNYKNSVKVNTGEQEKIYRRINEFFGEIGNKLEPKPLNRPSELEIRVNHVYDSRTGDYSSDVVCRLFYKQRVVAIVSESRDDLNFVVFDFFDNSGDYL